MDNLNKLNKLKNHFMRSILYVLAVILVIGWLLGVFVYSAKGLIHILIVLAVVALLLGLIRRA
jgi:predicted ferric reductase